MRKYLTTFCCLNFDLKLRLFSINCVYILPDGKLVSYIFNVLLKPVFQNTVEEIRYLCHVINSPPDLGHVMMLGHAHPEPLIRLASLHCGYSVVQTLQNSNHTLQHSSDPNGMSAVKYSIPQFRRDLIAISTTAGVRNERLVLLLTDKQIFNESFLTCIYEFVKGSAISALFSKEEQAKIINGVRGDMTQSGITFSAESAWSFFLR